MDRRVGPHAKACAVRAMRRVARVMEGHIRGEREGGKGRCTLTQGNRLQERQGPGEGMGRERKKFGRGCTRMYADKGEWTHGPCHRSGTSSEVFPPKERKNASRDDAVRLCVILSIVLTSVFTKRSFNAIGRRDTALADAATLPVMPTALIADPSPSFPGPAGGSLAARCWFRSSGQAGG